MGIVYIISYVVLLGAPTSAIYSINYSKKYLFCVGYCTFCAVMKITLIALLIEYGWVHIEKCYI